MMINVDAKDIPFKFFCWKKKQEKIFGVRRKKNLLWCFHIKGFIKSTRFGR